MSKVATAKIGPEDIFNTIDSWSIDELKQFIEKFKNKHSFLIPLPMKEYIEKRKAYIPPGVV